MSIRDLSRRIRHLLHRDEFAGDLDEEMRLHLELRARRLGEQGMDAEAARLAARRQFGNRAAVEIASVDAWGWAAWDRLAQDVLYALRALRKTPGFTAVVVATLAVGLGMNTAVFSVVNAVMLRSLPYRQPDRLVSLWEEVTQPDIANQHSSGRNLGGAGSRERTTVAAANIADYRAVGDVFAEVAGVETTQMNLTGKGSPERLTGERATAGYFSTLGISPEIGRTFTAEEDRPDAAGVVIISHDCWTRRLGGDTAVLGLTLMLDARPYQVIGVMPRAFQAATQFGQTLAVEFFVPAAYPRELLANRGDHGINVVGRLRDGASLQFARRRLDALSFALEKQFPDTNLGIRARIAPLRDDLVQNVKASLGALWGASALIVLITCVNVANLLLVRAVGRRHETSVRLALGAGRTRIVRQFLVESMLLASAGCAAGLLLGRILMRALVAAAPPDVPRLDTASLDWTVFGAAALIATVTGLGFGIAPAWHASRCLPGESLKTSERKRGTRSLTRWRGALTVAEIALSLVLLIGAGLFLRSFARIMGVDLGFRTENVLAMNIALPELRYGTADRRLRFFQELDQRASALPGVQAVAFANRLPLRGGWSTGVEIEGVAESYTAPQAQAVSMGYFETLGIPLLRGRLLTSADRTGAPHVAVVNRAFSREYLNGGDPIGRRFRRNPDAPWFQIVGMVNDVRRGGKKRDIEPQIYLAAAQTDGYPVRLADFAVRAAGDPRRLVHAIQQQVWALDQDQPVTGARTMEELISISVAEQRFQMLLLTLFAAVAVALAVVGIFGVLTYGVNQRMNELGIRIALGASPGKVMGLVLKQAGVLIACGVALGVAGALALTRLISNLLFQVRADDWSTYASAVGLLAAAGVAAAMIPARRGSRVDPIVALRYE